MTGFLHIFATSNSRNKIYLPIPEPPLLSHFQVLMQLTVEQNYALQAMLAGTNVFLTGEAGTGKSTIVHEFKRQTKKNCVFLAPTGIAAVNIGGCTIHSFLRLTPSLMSEESIGSIGNKKQRELIRSVEVIIIDEISMVRSDLFWAVDYRLRQVSQGSNKKRPFGGKQVIVEAHGRSHRRKA